MIKIGSHWICLKINGVFNRISRRKAFFNFKINFGFKIK